MLGYSQCLYLLCKFLEPARRVLLEVHLVRAAFYVCVGVRTLVMPLLLPFGLSPSRVFDSWSLVEPDAERQGVAHSEEVEVI